MNEAGDPLPAGSGNEIAALRGSTKIDKIVIVREVLRVMINYEHNGTERSVSMSKLLLAFAAALVVSLAACGEGNQQAAEEKAAQERAAAEKAAAEEAAADRAAAEEKRAKEIKQAVDKLTKESAEPEASPDSFAAPEPDIDSEEPAREPPPETTSPETPGPQPW